MFKITSKDKTLTILIIICFISGTLFISSYAVKKIQKGKDNSTVIKVDDSTKKLEQEISFKENLNVEINTSLPTIKDFVNNIEIYEEEKNQSIIFYSNKEEVTPSTSSLDTYNVNITYDGKDYESILYIVDTIKPEVKFKSIAIYEDTKYTAESFISSYEDNSNNPNYTATFKNQSQENLTKEGTYPITLSVCDESNNCTEETVNLVINKQNISINNQTQITNSQTSSNQKTTTVVKTETRREIINSIPFNYGVRKITYQDVTYEVYSDGTSKELSRSNSNTMMDFSQFNGTVHSMTNEAEGVYNRITTEINTIISKTNEYRNEVGLGNLTLDKDLSIAANIKAIEMAYSDKFDHTRPDGKEWDTLYITYFNQKGKNTPYKIGENLAVGYSSDLAACEGWKNSEGHYKNIIDTTFTKIGIGKYNFNGKTYWVQVFST